MGYNDHNVRQGCIASEGSRTVVPNFFFTRDRFLEDNFFRLGMRMVLGWVKLITLTVHFIPIVITVAALQITRIGSQRLGTPAERRISFFVFSRFHSLSTFFGLWPPTIFEANSGQSSLSHIILLWYLLFCSFFHIQGQKLHPLLTVDLCNCGDQRSSGFYKGHIKVSAGVCFLWRL